MEISVTLRTTLEFNSLDDFDEAVNMVMCDMTPDEILELAQRQGNNISVDVDGQYDNSRRST